MRINFVECVSAGPFPRLLLRKRDLESALPAPVGGFFHSSSTLSQPSHSLTKSKPFTRHLPLNAKTLYAKPSPTPPLPTHRAQTTPATPTTVQHARTTPLPDHTHFFDPPPPTTSSQLLHYPASQPKKRTLIRLIITIPTRHAYGASRRPLSRPRASAQRAPTKRKPRQAAGCR
ncbi:uncharacterized protein K452DRAFT_291851, partial [Aplosporella prunicola CBS 121167]